MYQKEEKQIKERVKKIMDILLDSFRKKISFIKEQSINKKTIKNKL